MTRVSNCIYCDRPITKICKEHVIPKALGATKKLSCVCSDCNNKILSQLDNELVSCPHIRLPIEKELKTSIECLWDYNKGLDLAIEAYQLLDFDSLKLWPQVIFDDSREIFFGDREEIVKVGKKLFLTKFHTMLKNARATLDTKKRPRWIWDPLDAPPMHGRFPPRVFTKHSFEEFSNRMHFICRYVEPFDREEFLCKLDKWKEVNPEFKFSTLMGSTFAENFHIFKWRIIQRSLVKIGLNLLTYLTDESFVNRRNFGRAISFVIEDVGTSPGLWKAGFVRNEDIQTLRCPPNSHRFWLSYDRKWNLDCSFFGGAVGATANFLGPPRIGWSRAEITVPLKSNKWKVKTFQLLVVRNMRVEWDRPELILPSYPISSSGTILKKRL